MIRARFTTDGRDYRPVEWPIKHPYWCSGYDSSGRAVIVAYADNEDEIRRLWPDAENIDGYVFTPRFPKPEWFK